MILTIRPKSEISELSRFLEIKNLDHINWSFATHAIKNKKILINKKQIYLISSIQAVTFLNETKKKNKIFLKNAKFFVIGSKVASKLKKLGVKKILEVFLDTPSLIKKLKIKYKDIELHHIRGPIKNDLLEEYFDNENLLSFTQVYATKYKKKLPKKVLVHMKNSKISIMMHYSLSAYERFMQLLNKKQKRHFIKKVIHFCLSKRIKLGLIDLGIPKDSIKVSKIPTSQSLVSLINSNH